MQSAKFRRILRQEADRWRSEGWIESDFYDRLAERYRFAGIETEASGTFITALIGLGGILIGLGILSFVAANWQYWSKVARIAILLVGFLVVNIGGFHLWQQANSRRLGQSLLLLGAIILGADMALLAQLFQISGDTFILFMGWSVGVVLMAYALGLTSLGVMAIALMGCGYWGAAAAGLDGRAIAPLWAKSLYEYMPIFSVALFLPLAYRCRSPLIFLLGAIAWLSSFQVAATAYTFAGGSGVDRPAVVLGCSLPPLLLWAAGRIQAHFPSLAYRKRVAQLSQRLGVFSGGLTCFVLSLDYFIPEVLRLRVSNSNFVDSWPLDRLLFLGLAIGLWIWLGRLAWPWTSNDRLMLLLGLCIAGLLTVASKSSWLPVPALFFVLLAIIMLICIQTSLQTADRGAFYFGWLLLLTRILTWFTFTQTDLMLKSLLFILSGVATVTLGWWFERRLRQAQ